MICDKTDRHDTTEILLKVAFNNIKQIQVIESSFWNLHIVGVGVEGGDDCSIKMSAHS